MFNSSEQPSKSLDSRIFALDYANIANKLIINYLNH